MLFLSYLWALSWSRLWPKRCDTKARWEKIHRRNAKRMYNGFVRLRGVYIKLGQILSVMGTFLPRYFTEMLEGLQDEVPPQSYHEISKSFSKAFGKMPHEVFAKFERVPVAAASLGQVHEARNAAGERLAVKILYPKVATIIKIDLKVLGWALRVYRTFVQIQQIERVHAQLADMLARETDLEHEARCIERMGKNFTGDPDVLFPKVYPEWTKTSVLTMSFMDGVKISRKTALAEIGLEPDAVAVKLTQVFYKQLFLDKFFHADPHPGNFFVQRGPNGQVRIVVLDLGAASDVRDNLADGMLDILQGLMVRNDNLVVRGIEEMGFVGEGGDRALLERTIKRYFEKLLDLNITDFSKIDPDIADHFADVELKREELRNLLKAVAYPEGWFYVERAVVIMFGLTSQLAPKLNTVQIGFPYVMQFVTERTQKRLATAPAASPRLQTSNDDKSGPAKLPPKKAAEAN